MSTEVRCPDCQSVWSVDRTAGGEMLCPSCMTRIPLDGPATVGPGEEAARRDLPPTAAREATDATPDVTANETAGRTETPEAGSTHRPVAPEREVTPVLTQPTAAVAAAPGTDPEWMYEQVVCPRCQLHFHPRSRPAESDVERKTILVVDDLAYFRQIAKDALQPTFDVRTAATSAEAREIMDQGGIDLLVLDLTLDGCNAGRDFLAELKPKPCPILIFTAQDESEMYGENWERLERLGADDLVIKGMQVAESLTKKASLLLGFPVDDEEPIG
jgi:CheY-like chemotaxis protein